MFRQLMLATVVAVAATLPTSSRAAELDNLLPAETEGVMFFNFRQMLDSKLMKDFALGQVKQMLEGNEAKQLLEQMGLDPLKDVDRVTAGFWGKDQEDMNVVMIVRGNFNEEKMFNTVKAQVKNNGDKIAIVEEGDYTFVKFINENNPKPFFAGFMDNKTIIGANDKKQLASIMKVGQKKEKPAIKRELANLLLKQDEKATMYMCGLVEGRIDNLPPNINIPGVDGQKLAEQLAKMSTFGVTLNITDEVTLELSMGMKDVTAADDFGDTLSQLVGTAKQFLPFISMNQPNMKALADDVSKSLKSKVKNRDVTLSLKISGDAISQATGAGD